MSKRSLSYLSCKEAALKLGLTPDYIRKLIKNGTLKAEKLGRDWIFEKIELKKFKRQRFPRNN